MPASQYIVWKTRWQFILKGFQTFKVPILSSQLLKAIPKVGNIAPTVGIIGTLDVNNTYMLLEPARHNTLRCQKTRRGYFALPSK